MRTGGGVVGLVLLALLAGCGSSGGGWQVISQVSAAGASDGFIDNAAVARPAQLEVAVAATPGITVRATYTFICGDVTGSATTRAARPVQTPATISLPPPVGPPNACRLNVRVQKSAPAKLTVTLRMRSLPSPSSP